MIKDMHEKSDKPASLFDICSFDISHLPHIPANIYWGCSFHRPIGDSFSIYWADSQWGKNTADSDFCLV